MDRNDLYIEDIYHYYFAGDIDSAFNIAKVWVDRAPNVKLAKKVYLHLLANKDDFGVETESTLKTYIKEFPTDPYVKHLLACTLKRHGDLDQAVALWTEAFGEAARRRTFSPHLGTWPMLYPWGHAELDSLASELASNLGWASDDKPSCFTFFHLPFTGGTSMTKALRLAFSPSKTEHLTQFPQSRYSVFSYRERDFNYDAEYLHLHVGYPAHQVMSNVNHRFFSLIRDPIDRIVSGYFKNKNNRTGINNDMPETLDQHIDELSEKGYINRTCLGISSLSLDAQHVDKLIDGKDSYGGVFQEFRGLSQNELFARSTKTVDDLKIFVGLTEQSDQSYFAAMLASGVDAIPYIMRIGQSGKPGAYEISESSKEKMYKEAEADFDFYSDMKTKFEERMKPFQDTFKRLVQKNFKTD